LTFIEVDFSLAVLGGCDLRGAKATGTRLEKADLRGALTDPSLWLSAKLSGAKIDVSQALAHAAAHGLQIQGE
jgi:uncharacterized protein YjbI with pentapeptide repeats